MNSATPLPGIRATADAVIAAAEAFYRARGAPALFCLPSMADGLDGPLAARGYGVIGRTLTVGASLASTTAHADPEVALDEAGSDAWIDAHRRLTATRLDDLPAFRETLGAIADTAAFAALHRDGHIVAQAYGVIHDKLLVIEAVATAPAYRRQGYARRVVGSLLAWGRANGAPLACLQVLADNRPALALYRGLGFSQDLYCYHYRAQPGSRWRAVRT